MCVCVCVFQGNQEEHHHFGGPLKKTRFWFVRLAAVLVVLILCRGFPDFCGLTRIGGSNATAMT